MVLTDEMITQIKNKAKKLDKKGRLILELNSFNGYYEIWIETGERFKYAENSNDR